MVQATDGMKRLIDAFASLSERGRGQRLKRMLGFITVFSAARVGAVRQGKVGFNVLSVLRIGPDEVRHTRVLAWLCDADAEHGLGSAFFEKLLAASGIALPADSFVGYEVYPEFSRQESIVDIAMFKMGLFLVYLENKIDAAEGFDQLGREHRDMRRVGETLCIPEGRQFAVFLTPEGRRPTTGNPEQWISISYATVAAVLGEVKSLGVGPKLNGLLEDLIETYGTWR